jgi:TRAP-type C4-dicarboxylate transport system permease small subunit
MKKYARIFINLDLILAGLSFVILVILTFIGVISRYFVNRPILWEEEVQLWLFSWIIFFGGSVVFRNRAHVAIELVVEFFPLKIRKVMNVLIYLVCLCGFMYLFINSMALVMQYVATNKVTSVIAVPYSLISAAIPIGCVLMFLNYTAVLIYDNFLSASSKKGSLDS